MSMKTHAVIVITFLLTMPFCASSAWREGFVDHDTLHLVGEGRAKADVPQIQAEAMARHAAIIDALGHWPKYCGSETNEAGIQNFRVENQKKRYVQCDGNICRARVVIQKENLRKTCGG